MDDLVLNDFAFGQVLNQFPKTFTVNLNVPAANSLQPKTKNFETILHLTAYNRIDIL